MADKVNYVTTKRELVEVDVPMQTRTYKPVTHMQLIDKTLEAIDKQGFTLKSEEYTMAREGKQANGRYTINTNDGEMDIMVGWQNSYDKSISLKFAIGARIFICSNGAVSGDMGTFRKKHQGDVQEFTPANIGEYIKGAGDVFYNLQQDRDVMKNREINKKVQAELLGRMFIDDAIITSTQLSIIKGEIEAPTHDYNSPNSMWELYNYATFAAKQEHPSKYYETHINLHKFFKAELS